MVPVVELARLPRSRYRRHRQERALLVKADILRRDDLGNTQRTQIETFTASVGRCVKFVRRHGIRTIVLYGQAASATIEEAAEDMAQLRDRLREFDVDCIYNVDETGIFYKL